jgi:hypothetical protein
MWCLVFLLLAQNYTGPSPAKADIPYLLHASKLIETEQIEAKEEKLKDGATYMIAGDHSAVRTPLASPIFLFKADRLNPEHLQLFQLQSSAGHREITFSKKKNPQTFTFTVKKLGGPLYRLEVNESLPAGEYSISPPDSNQTFCFAVF